MTTRVRNLQPGQRFRLKRTGDLYEFLGHKRDTMSNTPNLKPCPFCGGINIIHCGHHMYCHACGADGPDADSQHESEAIAAWNRRTPQPAVREPLTDEQIQDLLLCGNPTDEEMRLIRIGWDAAHDIKGGQYVGKVD